MLKSNNKMSKKTSEMVEDAKTVRRESFRPELIAYLREENGFIYFRIENIGQRAALNAEISIKNFFYNTQYEGSKEESEQFFIHESNNPRDVKKNILFLAPSQHIETILGDRDSIVEKNLNIQRSVHIKFYNLEKNMYKTCYPITTDDFRMMSSK